MSILSYEGLFGLRRHFYLWLNTATSDSRMMHTAFRVEALQIEGGAVLMTVFHINKSCSPSMLFTQWSNRLISC